MGDALPEIREFFLKRLGIGQGAAVDEEDIALFLVLPGIQEIIQFHGVVAAVQEIGGGVAQGVGDVHGRGERRRIGDFQVADLIHQGFVLQGRGHGVDAAHHFAARAAEALDAKHPPGLAVENQLQKNDLFFHIKMGPVELGNNDAGGIEPGRLGFGHGETRAGQGAVKHLYHKAAHGAVKGGLTAGDIGADDPALAVGHGAQREIGRLAGDQVGNRHAIAAGIDVRISGLHFVVDHDQPLGRQFQTGFFG